MAQHCNKSEKEQKESVNDPEMISMVASGAILIGGFCVIAFVSGPLGLFLTLLSLSILAAYYVYTGGK